MAGRGTGYFAKRQRERQAQFSNPFLFLSNDGDSARVRFLEEPKDGLFCGVFHRPFTNGRVQNPVICVEQDEDVPNLEGVTETCALCEGGDNPGLKFFLYVYVYHIDHDKQNPALEKDAAAPKWKAVKVGKGDNAKTMFRQPVNKTKVLLGGKRLKDLVDELEESAAEDGETLLACDYKFIRHGVKRDPDTTYVFREIKKSTTLKKEVKEAIDKLGDISEVAMEGSVVFFSSGAAVAEEPEEEPEEEEETTAAEEDDAEEEADDEEESEEEEKDPAFAKL